MKNNFSKEFENIIEKCKHFFVCTLIIHIMYNFDFCTNYVVSVIPTQLSKNIQNLNKLKPIIILK